MMQEPHSREALATGLLSSIDLDKLGSEDNCEQCCVSFHSKDLRRLADNPDKQSMMCHLAVSVVTTKTVETFAGAALKSRRSSRLLG